LHNAAHLPDRYLTWGDFPRRALLKQNLMTERQVKTVGCPRFDFYSEPLIGLMPEKKELLKRLGFSDFSAPIVLWATNTPYSSREASVIIERQTKRAKKPLAEVQAHLEDHKTQFREHSQIVLELARRHPEWNFIIKVHPAEWINPYLDLEKETLNLKVAYNAPIGQFLRHADVLLQRNCTTATEAWMFGKPVINLEIGEYRRPVRDEYARGNHQVFSVCEAETAIINYLDGAEITVSQQRARAEFIADFYHKIDGKSHERCAAAIHEVLSAPEYTTEAQTLKNKLTKAAINEKKKRDDARLINKVKDLLGVDRDQTLRFWKKYFRKEAVHNAGKFTAEPEITGEMAAELYQKFDALLTHEKEFVKTAEKEVLLSSP
jgi:surface carbohydrate biosynthesis protein